MLQSDMQTFPISLISIFIMKTYVSLLKIHFLFLAS